jgi:hypothetical protein
MNAKSFWSQCRQVVAGLAWTTLSAASWAGSGENAVENPRTSSPTDLGRIDLAQPFGWKAQKAPHAQLLWYPSIFTYDNTPVTLYLNVANKQSLKARSAGELFERDLAQIKARYPDGKGIKVMELRSKDGASVPVYLFAYGNLEALVAMIEKPDSIAMLVLRARDGKWFSTAQDEFKRMVSSFSWK